MSLKSVKIVTSTETLDSGYDTFLIDATNGNITFTLVDIVADGMNFGIKRIDTSNNVVTIQGYNSAQTIDGATTVTFDSEQSNSVLAYNNVWYTFT